MHADAPRPVVDPSLLHHQAAAFEPRIFEQTQRRVLAEEVAARAVAANVEGICGAGCGERGIRAVCMTGKARALIHKPSPDSMRPRSLPSMPASFFCVRSGDVAVTGPSHADLHRRQGHRYRAVRRLT